MSTPLVVQKTKWVILDLGWPHSLMALAAASLPNFGTSTTTMSCLASNEGAMYSHTLGFSFKISSVKCMYLFLIMDFSPEIHGKTKIKDVISRCTLQYAKLEHQ
jgi:hypothetical protein